jgi:hypothetical protein
MTDADRIRRYTCALCDRRFVVPDLARSCEEKHLDLDHE